MMAFLDDPRRFFLKSFVSQENVGGKTATYLETLLSPHRAAPERVTEHEFTAEGAPCRNCDVFLEDQDAAAPCRGKPARSTVRGAWATLFARGRGSAGPSAK